MLVNVTFIRSLPVLLLSHVVSARLSLLGHLFNFPLCKDVVPIVILNQTLMDVQAIILHNIMKQSVYP
jgi:hypothetical protein